MPSTAALTTAAASDAHPVAFAVELDPVNLPGTVDQYPNWRRKLSLTLKELLVSPKWLPPHTREVD
jgi:glycogen operon protein